LNRRAAKSDGRFGKQDLASLPEDDAYRCPMNIVGIKPLIAAIAA
jgi:hypothetical protein